MENKKHHHHSNIDADEVYESIKECPIDHDIYSSCHRTDCVFNYTYSVWVRPGESAKEL